MMFSADDRVLETQRLLRRPAVFEAATEPIGFIIQLFTLLTIELSVKG